MLRPRLACLPLALVALVACSGSDATSSHPVPDAAVEASPGEDAAPDAAADATADSEPDTTTEGSASLRGTCQTTVDCEGRACLGLSADANAWHTCAAEPAIEATECANPPLDECCSSAECVDGDHGACVDSTLWYCGGVEPEQRNTCVYDECASAADCSDKPHGVCVPAGAFREVRSACAYGDCVVHEDCTSRSGGECHPFFEPCRGRFVGLFCTYDDSACRSDADCPQGDQHCTPGTDGVTACETWQPPP